MRRFRPALSVTRMKRTIAPLLIIAFAATGILMLSNSSAATMAVAYEAEDGALQKAVAVNASGTSGGKAVRFDTAGTGNPPGLRTVPHPLYGVTIESVTPLNDIVASLDRHMRMTTTRIVFQEGMGVDDYTAAVDRIQPVSYILGEILDSEGVANTTVSAYRSRAESFVNAYKGKVDIWEIGNEVNGEWLVKAPRGEAQQQEVADKIAAAFDVVEAQDLRSALTLSYFPTTDCRANSWEDMIWWAQNRVPQRLKTDLDYVLVSWYEDSCSPAVRPSVAEWNRVFGQLRAIFPNSKLGFGEVGTMAANDQTLAKRQETADYYYGLSLPGKITVDSYIGGYFWWYYHQEAVPWNKAGSIWPILENNFNKY